MTKPVHYFASSIAEWRTGTDLGELTHRMARSGFPFTLWKLPVPEDADYMIERYVPQVEGREFLGKFDTTKVS